MQPHKIPPFRALNPNALVRLPGGVTKTIGQTLADANAEKERGERAPLPRPYTPPLMLPEHWRILHRDHNGAVFFDTATRLRVIASAQRERDGKAWMHVSLSYQDRTPSYEDVGRVKALFIGEDATALQVFPPKGAHVNYMKHCLHLFHCLDGDVTPDFRTGGMI